jgi:hypothetical protein
MNAWVLWPAIVQAVLIGLVYVLLSFTRGKSVVAGRVPDTNFPPWDEPRDSAEIRRHLQNQFEMPILFFAAVGFLVATDTVTSVDFWLAWGFVASRVLHSIGALLGPLWLRHAAFFGGAILVAGLWLHLAITLI